MFNDSTTKWINVVCLVSHQSLKVVTARSISSGSDIDHLVYGCMSCDVYV